jgi:mannose-6-phosphate isomerase-like protein (cupin superfamily)
VTIHVVDHHEGEILVAGPMSIRILEDGNRTGGRLGLVEVTLPPHASGPLQHLHREHDETFFVLSGQPTFTSGTEEITLGAGALLTAPIGTPHTFANPGPERQSCCAR